MREPSLHEIIDARNQCAQIIANYGGKYLPIFERLENEIELRNKNLNLLDEIKKINFKNNVKSTIGELKIIFKKASQIENISTHKINSF